MLDSAGYNPAPTQLEADEPAERNTMARPRYQDGSLVEFVGNGERYGFFAGGRTCCRPTER